MATQERQPRSAVSEALDREPCGFSFFQAVRLLEELTPGVKPLGEATRPREEAVNFCVRPGFAFPPSDIAGLTKEREGGPARMEVAFLGLIGPSGVLPHWYNELARERNRQKDFSLTAYLDIFHHRLLSLFYLAWKRNRFDATYRPECRDRLSRCLLSLLGLGTPGLTERLGAHEEDLIFYGGLLSRTIPSAAALERVIGYFSGTQTRVEQFLPRRIRISPEDQTQFGVANSRLGMDALCGSWVWDRQSAFRVHLGPMGYGQFVGLLPTGSMSRSVFSITRYATGIQYDCDLRVILRRTEVPPCVLGSQEPRPLLGWSTWVSAPGFEHTEDPAIIVQPPAASSARG
ncbi:MAG TPA: type VI secretion system baseplate subunit TssG [Candidatus Methylomirabilis sp.]|nr:type VI secretion system baseplate subunit TssG [Candidatus Methylomirabilis sp.]HSC71570.1 type VI secretion system baseplate subunit TssG [Candidatus Methylomirabilis sp.]